MANQRIINKIRKYLIALSNNGLPVQKAILYGSRARGTAGKESDIDLLLISSLFDSIEEKKFIPIIWTTASKIDYKIEPIAVGEKRWLEDDTSPLLEIARREGIEIFP